MAKSKEYIPYTNNAATLPSNCLDCARDETQAERVLTFTPRYQLSNTKSHRRKPPRSETTVRLGVRLDARPVR